MSRVRIQRVLFVLIVFSMPQMGMTQPRSGIRILYEAGAGGVSGGATRDALQGHWVTGEGSTLSVQGSGYGALYSSDSPLNQGGGYLFLQNSTTISELLSFLDTEAVSVIESTEVNVLRSRQGVYLQDFLHRFEPDPEGREAVTVSLEPGYLREEVRVERWSLYRMGNADGGEAFFLRPGAVNEEVSIDLERSNWEVRLRTDYVQTSTEEAVELVGFERRLGEGTRRLRYVQEQFDVMGVNTAFVSAGDSVEGQSWVMGESLNLQRPGSFAAMSGLLDVLVPASGELASGVGPLKVEAEDASIALVSANIMDIDSGESVFNAHHTLEDDALQIVFVGLTDPSVNSELPPEVQEEIFIAAPQESLTRVISSLYSLEDPPDLVILVTGLTGERQDLLLTDRRGVDLIIGPEPGPGEQDRHYGWQDASEQVRVSLQSGYFPSEQPLIHRVPSLIVGAEPYEIGQVDLSIVDGQINSFTHELLLVDQSWPFMREALVEINRVRQAVYEAHQQEMLWDWRLAPPLLRERLMGLLGHFQGDEDAVLMAGGYNYGLWLTLVANLMRRETGADVALLRSLPEPPVWVGSVNELALNEALRERDRLLLYRMDGARLSQLLALRGSLYDSPSDAAHEVPPPMVSGADLLSQAVAGRPIENRAGYTVVTTDYYANEADVREILSGLTPERRFLSSDEGWIPGETGTPLFLHELVVRYLGELQELRTTGDVGSEATAAPLQAAYWEAIGEVLDEPGGTRRPLIRFEIEEIGVALNQVSRAAPESGYEDVRNSRVTQGESLTLSTRAHMALVLDTEPIIVSLGGRMAYGQLRVEGESTENADDLIAELDLQIRHFDLGWARGFRPYVTSRFDSELTPAEPSEEGASSPPRQQEMNNSVGLVADFSSVFPEFRLGLVQFTDFAKTEDRGALGAELILTELAQWGPVTQGLRIQGNYYFPSDSDSAEDLGLTLTSRFNLAIPLIGSVALEAFVDTLVFRGKLESNNEFGLNIQTGFGLTYGDIFRRPLR